MENYKKADLNFGVFPTIGNMSYLIREISPLKIKKIVKNREEFNVLIKKIKSQKEKVSEFFTKEFKAFFKDLYNRHYEDILRIGEGIDFGKKKYMVVLLREKKFRYLKVKDETLLVIELLLWIYEN